MAHITIKQARDAAQRVRVATRKSDTILLREARETTSDRFDIFLSHSSIDKELVLGAKQLIEERGLSVYVDWIEDAELSRAAVDRERADHLRNRMQQCEALFYAHTPNAALSRWCPWELGYFDALKRPQESVFVLPIVSDGDPYKGQEYLSLYEPVDISSYGPPVRTRRRPDAVDERLLRDLLGMRRHGFRDIF
jgi:hypothetical protein